MRLRKHARPSPARLDPALVEAVRLIPVPAFIVTAYGEVITMNAHGHGWLEHGASRQAALRRAGGPDPEVFSVTPSRGDHGTYSLVVLRCTDARPSPHCVPARWGLTPREEEVATCILRGVTNQQIATELGCANATIERHVSSILRKANVTNRASLIVAMVTG